MKTLAALGILCALLQDKSPVSISSDPPTENAWPINGRVSRPNGSVVKLSAVRVERRWDASQDRFREFSAAESRIMKSAEIDGRSFRANLKSGPSGLYELTVAEGDQKLHTERLLLGSPAALFASTRKSVEKMIELCDRATANLDEIERVLKAKQPGTEPAKEAFIKRVHADEQLLRELSVKSDLTGSAALLDEICSQIRNAQVWGLSGGKSTEQRNDGEGAAKDIFLDPKLSFKILHGMIDAVRSVVSRELSLSAASILDALFARAEERPEKQLSKAKSVALEALKLLAAAPLEDKEARAVIEAAAVTESPGLAETRKALQALIAKHRGEP